MANHALPITTSLYTDVLTNLKDRIDDSLKMLDSVNTTPTNVPTNSVRFNSTTFLWEKYNGSAWVSLASSYAIQVSKSINLTGGNSTTLLGSIPYQSNTDSTTLLAPNTTTTRKFLRQTGSGTNGSAPVWDTILASDIPTLNQNTTGSAGSCTGNSATATTATNVNGGTVNATTGTFSGLVKADGVGFRSQNWNGTLTDGVYYFGNATSYILKQAGAFKFYNQEGAGEATLTTSGQIVTANGGTWSINATTATSAGSCTGNSATATKLTSSQGDWSASGVIGNVVGMLAWKKYNNNHVIFDASDNTTPNGSGINNTDAQYPWSSSHPTLMGWNGYNTYGVRVDSARVADYATNTIGYGQSWQDVTASRSVGTTYTNSTGKPIEVVIHFVGSANLKLSGTANTRGGYTRSAIIPNNGTYSTLAGYAFLQWLELR